MKLVNIVTGFRQLTSMGAWPYFAAFACAAFLLGVGTGAYPTFLLTRAVYQRATLKAENNLTKFRAELAESKTSVLTEQARLQGVATGMVLDAVKRGTERLSGQLARASDAAAIASLNENVLTLQKDIRYACRNLPLPADYLDGLRIPRREAPSPRGNGNQP